MAKNDVMVSGVARKDVTAGTSTSRETMMSQAKPIGFHTLTMTCRGRATSVALTDEGFGADGGEAPSRC